MKSFEEKLTRKIHRTLNFPLWVFVSIKPKCKKNRPINGKLFMGVSKTKKETKHKKRLSFITQFKI